METESRDHHTAMRVIDLITTASGHLEAKGFDNARLEVERLLGHVLGLRRIDLYMAFERPLTEEEMEKFRSLYRRRLKHEPLQYIMGSAGFRELDVKTAPRVFIPRPETEMLVQEAIDFLSGRSDPIVADLGTGSGAIAVSIAYEVPGARVIAVDVSDDALLLTEQNARRAGVAESITFVSANMLEGLEGRGPFDAVLSNPPYVRRADIETLQDEIRDYEPRTALDGGPDGFDYITPIVEGAVRFLKPGGLLLLECGDDQAETVRAKLEILPHYTDARVITDLAGKKRLVRALCR